MQIKTTMRYHLIPERRVIIKRPKKTPKNPKKTKPCKHWQECGKKETIMNCRLEYKLLQPLQKTVWSHLKISKIELPYDPSIPLLSTYPKRTETLIQKDICMPMSTAALF